MVATNPKTLGIDPARLAVGGDSAGGNLAAEASGRARHPTPLVTIADLSGDDACMGHASVEQFAEGYLLTRSTMRWFYEQYLREPGEAADWRVSPLLAADLAGVAPAFVITAGYDPLCDEGDAYARRLETGGVTVRHRRFDGQIHGFACNGKIIRAATEALGEAATS
jgi:acetyl esterase